MRISKFSRYAVVAAASFMAQSAVAQTMTEADCTALWKNTTAVNASLSTKTFGSLAISDGWCRFEAVVIGSDETYSARFEIGVLSFRGDGLNGLFELSEPPTSLDVKVENLVIAVTIDDPLMSYLMRAQAGSQGINADMSIDWDASTKVLSLRKFDVDFPGENAILATASIKGVDLGSLAEAKTNVMGFALTAFDGSITSNGLFEGYMLMPLGTALLGPDEPPEAQVAALKAEATAVIAKLPDATFAAGSKAALTAVVAQMPNPAGKLDFSIKSDVGVGPARFVGLFMSDGPSSIDDLAPIFDGVTVEVVFEPSVAE
jgi:hypothetical protein